MYHLPVVLFNKVNGRRYRQGRELAGKTTRRRIRRWGLNPESAGRARTCPVHAVLGRFCKTVLNLSLIFPLITAYIGGRFFEFLLC